MSEELEALKEINNACLLKKDKWEGFVDVPIYLTEQYKIIETALKDKEELAQTLSIITCENGDLLKYKKAFKIIKNKKVSTQYFIGVCKLFKKHKGKVLVWGNTYTSKLKYYNDFLYERLIGESPISTYKKRRYLTQEEYDLLEEVLL